ncbi:hypothetical protein COU00_03155 [Candidatus Falkowbacteria bacterium CG10_big_fil_rev_8_21_14_0_10_43_11]|uniref:Uncharacterized protein n=1 Tax=Candidatus Falkowbacteria bacterium CG10_big_fil_rev_8_21_14_0_10_43_11 TaxID=1974568 RepID=A0A2M6WLS4_9BACT|nr:MAG: hypothetical protein COU00_03155 [Candidatus Falkowbacteria bacterium CG10_big_fil_rev_8_21_14_0_10_43_11]
MRKNAKLGKQTQQQEMSTKSTFIQHSRNIKQNGKQFFQEPSLARLVAFAIEQGKIHIQMSIHVFLVSDGECGKTDEFQINFVAYECPRASKETMEYSLSISVKNLNELETWRSRIIASVEAVCGEEDALIAQKINNIFNCFSEDQKWIEEEAVSAHTKRKNGKKK